MTFGFDERYAMFDVTPVENQFILELLPGARGEYVKVYLYGLMKCYHPEADSNLDEMAHELNMTPEEIESAYRYWERRGAVRRISDKPPVWQYVNLKQRMLENNEGEDPEYEAFSTALYDVFDNGRRLHGGELVRCFEWQEDLKLPTEVIIMLLKHMAKAKGKQFKIQDAEKIALEMAQENVNTIEAAEEFLSRDRKIYEGVRGLLKKMGKRYLPSEAQTAMYRKWIKEWHFTPEAIEAALEKTAGGDPSMGYVDGILKKVWEQNQNADAIDVDRIQTSSDRRTALRQILDALGKGRVGEVTLEQYDRMAALYPQEIIIKAARECARSGSNPEDVLKLLESWKKKGLETGEQVDAYIHSFREQTELIRELKAIWGLEKSRTGETDRSLLSKWQNELGYSRKMILTVAPAASEAKKPMSYLDAILSEYRKKGITTPEAAEQEMKKKPALGSASDHSGTKTVLAQQYGQRDYSDVPDEIRKKQNEKMEAFLKAKKEKESGGKPDA